MPVMVPPAAVRRPMAMATASSSSMSNGGMSAPGLELIPAGRPGGGPDRITQLPEPVDVTAERPFADLQAVHQFLTRPAAAGLEQGQETQGPGGGGGHLPRESYLFRPETGMNTRYLEKSDEFSSVAESHLHRGTRQNRKERP